MLYLDATVEPPGWSVVLTTRDPQTSDEAFRRGCQNVWRALRRAYGRVDYFMRIEFTTGLAALSGGYRRIHGHAAVKGLAGAEEVAATELCRHAWLARNAGAWRVEVTPLRTPAGLLAYLNLHHAKAEQLPPAWWPGRTERASRGYWTSDPAALREEARRQIWAEGLAYSRGISVLEARADVDAQCEQREFAETVRRALHEVGEWVPIAEAPLEVCSAQESFPF